MRVAAPIGAMFAKFVAASAGFAKRKQSTGVHPLRVLNKGNLSLEGFKACLNVLLKILH